MATLLQLYNRIQRVKEDEVIEETMDQSSPVITEKQREQMLTGVNSEGKKIGKYRSPAYARKKNAMNPLPGLGVPDLRLTGQFYKGIYTEIRGDKIITDSTDEKTQDLADKYGENIFGLNKDKKAEAVEKIKPVLVQNMKNAMGL